MTNGNKNLMSESDLRELVAFPDIHPARAYVNSYVRFHHAFTIEQRMQAALDAGWNVFQFPSEMLIGGDLLSDSGTTTLTLEQLSAMLLGDESYGSNWGYFQLLDQFEKTFGMPREDCEVYLFHQGRAAEHAFFSQLGRLHAGGVIPNNGHFDTTRANIEASGLEAIDLFSEELDTQEFHPFKGNMNLAALDELISQRRDAIPVVYATITNNTGGGQPVSLENLQAIHDRCVANELPFFLDACRFAENACFIQHREEAYAETSIADIVKKTFSLCEGFTISLKKDGLSNMGGALVLRKNGILARKYPGLLNDLRDYQILVEGHPTYGGLSGRDIMTITEGLKTVTTEEYLHSRIGQVQKFGDMLADHGIPILQPYGGHAIYIDMDKFFADTTMSKGDFGGISLTALLLLRGIRLCELGAFAFGKYNPKTKQETYPKHNYVRCAIPRNKYEQQDLQHVADCVGELYRVRHQLPRAIPISGRELSLRHFKAKFALASLE